MCELAGKRRKGRSVRGFRRQAFTRRARVMVWPRAPAVTPRTLRVTLEASHVKSKGPTVPLNPLHYASMRCSDAPFTTPQLGSANKVTQEQEQRLGQKSGVRSSDIPSLPITPLSLRYSINQAASLPPNPSPRGPCHRHASES